MTKSKLQDINKKIQEMIKNNIPDDEILRFVKGNCQTIQLTPMTLGMLFEIFAGIKYDENDPTTCFSQAIPINQLVNIHPGFASTNGCQWARSDGSYLGKKYIIKRPLYKGKVFAIQLDGPNNNSIKKHRSIKKEIVEKLSKMNCAILDVSTNIEIDHKNGRYNELTNIDTANQNIDDFQPLSKSANDAKRQHCKRCVQTGQRYNAKILGYKEGWIVGDEKTPTCIGCYWYDPKRFNELISKNFIKKK